METKADYKYQDLKELEDNFNSVQMKLNNKIEDYLLEILNKFNDNFIEFDERQQEETKYIVNGNIATLTALQIEFYNYAYVELSFSDNYGNDFTESLTEMTTEQQISIVEDVRKYINKYGYKSSELNTTLQQFLAYCIEEGCTLYFGIKTSGDSRLTGTLFARNDALGYNHVMSVVFPTDIISGGNSKVASTLYAYIPLHNVTEKFFK